MKLHRVAKRVVFYKNFVVRQPSWPLAPLAFVTHKAAGRAMGLESLVGPPPVIRS